MVAITLACLFLVLRTVHPFGGNAFRSRSFRLSMNYFDKIEAMKTTWEAVVKNSMTDVTLPQSRYTFDIEKHLQACINEDILNSVSMTKQSGGSLRVTRRFNDARSKPSRIYEAPADDYLYAPERDDEVVLEVTKRWVKAIIADFAVCPFTIEPDRAGIPRGNVRYAATSLDEAIMGYWQEAHAMMSTTDREISTVILVYPELALFGEDMRAFDLLSELLDDALSPKTMEPLDHHMNNVYFHPTFRFRDKDDQVRFVFDDAGEVIGTTETIVEPFNYARRSPWPIINILRSQMVQSAQKGIPEGRVFEINSARLKAVGSAALQDMLDRKDWSGLPLYSQYAIRQTEKQQSLTQTAASSSGGRTADGLKSHSQEKNSKDNMGESESSDLGNEYFDSTVATTITTAAATAAAGVTSHDVPDDSPTEIETPIDDAASTNNNTELEDAFLLDIMRETEDWLREQ